MNVPQPLPVDAASPFDEEDGEPGIFEVEDREYEARLDAEADADVAAGRVVSNAAVIRWIRSWGTDNELPRPEWGE